MPGTTTVTPTGILAVDAVDGGTIWSTTSLTYSFPTSASFYTKGAYGSGEPLSNFKAFTPVQQAAVTSALAMYSSVSNLTFTQITERSTQSATLRYAESTSRARPGATIRRPRRKAATPGSTVRWHWYNNPVLGNYAWVAMIHETGHLLGLKHPHNSVGCVRRDAGRPGFAANTR